MLKVRKSMKNIIYKPIGIIKTPFNNIKGMPIQPIGAKDIEGIIEIKPEYAKCLKDLSGFSHISLIYHFHLSKGFQSEVIPFMDNEKRGLFSTRAPKRPNPIGISIVRLIKVDGLALHIKDIDVVTDTPLLDIKPFVAEIDMIKNTENGWMGEKLKKMHELKSDERFK
jgi:tRNA-Thr(GGU) m(6)t(6)A37 methyltransferase TsaA